jgi:hypothetical protein
VFRAALEAVVLGDASRFGELFTDDVVFTSPHLTVESLAMVQRGLGSPEDSLTDVDIVVVVLDTLDDKVIAEWRLEALFTRPVLYDDRFLIEPTGGGVRLPGMSVAEFRGRGSPPSATTSTTARSSPVRRASQPSPLDAEADRSAAVGQPCRATASRRPARRPPRRRHCARRSRACGRWRSSVTSRCCGDVEPIGHGRDREVRRQQLEHPQLGRRQRAGP